MKKAWSLIGLAFLVSACSSAPQEFTPQTTVRIVNTTVYPDLPDVPAVPDPGLIAWSYDFPRDTSQVTIKNITSCLEVDESNRDSAFWNRCGENPIISETNIFIGLTRENWDILNSNLKKLQENIYLYRRRIEQVNRQRNEWRQRAQEQRTSSTETTVFEQDDTNLGPAKPGISQDTEKTLSIFGFKF